MKNFILFILSILVLINGSSVFAAGIVNQNNKLIKLPAKTDYNDRLAIVSNKNSMYGFVNKSGKIIIPPIYDSVTPFKNGTSVVCKNAICGLINIKGKEIIPIDQKYISTEYNELRYIIPKEKYIVYDLFGNLLYDFGNYSVEAIYTDSLILRNKYKYALVNINENIPPKFNYNSIAQITNKKLASEKEIKTDDESKTYQIFSHNNKWGIKETSTGKILTSPQYILKPRIVNNYIFIDTSDKIKYINNNGEPIVTVQDKLISNVRDFNDELAAFEKDNKWGYIDKTGNISIQAKFNSVSDFNENYAIVKDKKNKTKIINTQGRYTTRKNLNYIGNFHNGLCRIKDNKTGLYGYINPKGKIIINAQYKEAEDFNNGIAKVLLQNDASYKYIDNAGNYIVNPD